MDGLWTAYEAQRYQLAYFHDIDGNTDGARAWLQRTGQDLAIFHA